MNFPLMQETQAFTSRHRKRKNGTQAVKDLKETRAIREPRDRKAPKAPRVNPASRALPVHRAPKGTREIKGMQGPEGPQGSSVPPGCFMWFCGQHSPERLAGMQWHDSPNQSVSGIVRGNQHHLWRRWRNYLRPSRLDKRQRVVHPFHFYRENCRQRARGCHQKH